jgi:RNA polymerase sigma-70 factor, ECF subfamily
MRLQAPGHHEKSEARIGQKRTREPFASGLRLKPSQEVNVLENNPQAAPNPERLLPCGARELPRRGGAVDFERLYQMHSQRVSRLCRRMVWDKSDAEDLTQEVFIQLLRKIDSFRGESAFTTWLTRVTVNVVLMQLRKKPRIESSIGEGNELGEPSAHSPEELGDPRTAPMSVVTRLDLKRAMAQLPSGFSQVFALHDVEGYAHTEIAHRLGISEGTSKSQLHKARRRLRDLLRGAGSRYPQTEEVSYGKSKCA